MHPVGGGFAFANFNDIFAAVLTIFRCVTMEGWTTLCYALMAKVGPDWQWAVVLYFVALLLLVTHLVVNLFVAVICTQFAGYRCAYNYRLVPKRRAMQHIEYM
jgi:voltage-dependent calcium channel L type alpha-1F